MTIKEQIAQIKQESLVKWLIGLLGEPFEIRYYRDIAKQYCFHPKTKKNLRNCFPVLVPNDGIDDYELAVGEVIRDVCHEVDRKDYNVWIQRSIDEIMAIQDGRTIKEENKKNKIYQLCIKGSQKYCEGVFTCFSKKVYKHEPTDEEKQEFVGLCCDEKDCLLNVLDRNKEYKVSTYELDIVE